MDKKKKTKLGKINDEQLDMLASYFHELIAYSSLSMYYALTKALSADTPLKVKEQELDIIERILQTSNMTYEDLNDEQKELLREEALIFLENIK